jgi:hypothetical protein
MSEIPCDVCGGVDDHPSIICCDACLAMARGFYSAQKEPEYCQAESMVERAMRRAIGLDMLDPIPERFTRAQLCAMACAAVAALRAKR